MKRGKTRTQKKPPAEAAPRTEEKPRESVSGTYVYDEHSDSIVKISDRIPSVASKSGHSHAAPSGCGSCASTAQEILDETNARHAQPVMYVPSSA